MWTLFAAVEYTTVRDIATRGTDAAVARTKAVDDYEYGMEKAHNNGMTPRLCRFAYQFQMLLHHLFID